MRFQRLGLSFAAALTLAVMPSGADLGEIMRSVPAPQIDACIAWAKENGVNVVRGTTRARVGGEDCPSAEIVPRIQKIARDRALDAWRARKSGVAAAARANGPSLADVKDQL